MKKTLLTLLVALTGLCATAQSEKNYTEQYVVTENGTAMEPQTANVTVVDNGNGTINFILRDFVLHAVGQEIPVGDVALNDVPASVGDDELTHFSKESTFAIPATSLPAEFQAYAFLLSSIPYALQGKCSDTKLYATIDININALSEQLFVEVGTDIFPPKNGRIYTEPLVLTINGDSTAPQDANVVVIENTDGTITFELKNFFLSNGGESIPVGNIRVENIPVTTGEDGLSHFAFNGIIQLQPGDMDGVDFWTGPALGDIPLVLQGKMNDDKLFVTIDIDMMDKIGQICYVQLGTDDFPVVIKGDVNGDGKVNVADAQRILILMADSAPYSAIADINGNGSIEIADAQSILIIMADQGQ